MAEQPQQEVHLSGPTWLENEQGNRAIYGPGIVTLNAQGQATGIRGTHTPASADVTPSASSQEQEQSVQPVAAPQPQPKKGSTQA